MNHDATPYVNVRSVLPDLKNRNKRIYGPNFTSLWLDFIKKGAVSNHKYDFRSASSPRSSVNTICSPHG